MAHHIPFPKSRSRSTQSRVTNIIFDTAIWLERRLDLSLGFHLPAARMYGIVVNDPAGLRDDHAGSARASFIDEHRDVYAMITGAPGVLARSFDAAAVVTCGWAAPLDDDGTVSTRPSRHPDRRRVRAVAVVSDDGIASVVRFEDEPDVPMAEAGRGTGEVIDALEAMWFGPPSVLITGPVDEDVDRLVNMRTTRGGCSRWP